MGRDYYYGGSWLTLVLFSFREIGVFMFWKLNFNVLKKEVNLLFRIVPKREVMQFGVGNRCRDGTYLVFLDYDSTPYEWIREELLLMQRIFGLGTAFIFKTKHGWHVIFLEKLPLGLVIDVLKMSTVDMRYREVPMMYGRKIWILRQSKKRNEKSRYWAKIPQETLFVRSRAHARYLVSMCGVPRGSIGRGTFDEEDNLTLGYYRTPEE